MRCRHTSAVASIVSRKCSGLQSAAGRVTTVRGPHHGRRHRNAHACTFALSIVFPVEDAPLLPQDARLQSVGPTAGAAIAWPAGLHPNERVAGNPGVQDISTMRSSARTASDLGWGDTLSFLQW